MKLWKKIAIIIGIWFGCSVILANLIIQIDWTKEIGRFIGEIQKYSQEVNK